MKYKKLFIVLCLIIILAGCGDKNQPVINDTNESSVTVTFTSGGEEIVTSVPLQPKRVVVIGDTGIETMLHFGESDKIVGVAYLNQSFSKYQSDIEELPLINKSWASKEAILLLEPDLIISIDSALQAERSGTISYWNQKGIAVIGYSDFTEGMSINNFKRDAENIMTPFERKDEVIAYFEQWVPEYKSLNNVPKVLFLSASPNGMYYFDPSWCLISEVIQDLGGEYIKLSDQMYLEVSTEALLKADPDYIILTEHLENDAEEVKHLLTKHPLLKDLSAVKNDRLLVVNYTSAIQGNYDIPELYAATYNLLKETDYEK